MLIGAVVAVSHCHSAVQEFYQRLHVPPSSIEYTTSAYCLDRCATCTSMHTCACSMHCTQTACLCIYGNPHWLHPTSAHRLDRCAHAPECRTLALIQCIVRKQRFLCIRLQPSLIAPHQRLLPGQVRGSQLAKAYLCVPFLLCACNDC
jgi:hypothetical protein